ncbi:MAG: type II toxin-antitoxin system toxin component ParE1 [Oceanicaulis sp. HLUCCA04]|nr:MAG: type II toxin-antitoxin system toxin component ParE1 [Oceanicaulis sp. HLUCCA04]
MTTVRLTRRAAATLADIADWTFSRFGPQQAEIYRAELITTCQGLITPSPIERCVDGFGPAASGPVLYVRASMHFIVFRRMRPDVEILDFLHVRSDLAARLEALGKEL